MAKFKIQYLKKTDSPLRKARTTTYTVSATWFEAREQWIAENPDKDLLDFLRK